MFWLRASAIVGNRPSSKNLRDVSNTRAKFRSETHLLNGCQNSKTNNDDDNNDDDNDDDDDDDDDHDRNINNNSNNNNNDNDNDNDDNNDNDNLMLECS